MPMPLKDRLLRYLETLSGERLDLLQEEAVRLPLFLRERYSIFSTRLFGKQTVLALEQGPWEVGTPGEYEKHEGVLRSQFGSPVILVLPSVPSHTRNRMVLMGLPFIVPGSQMFLPGTLIDLRERFPQPAAKPRKSLSPAAQCTLLYHLVRKPTNQTSLKELAVRLGYSPMMMTKVKDELEASGICEAERSGRALFLGFKAKGRGLWEVSKPMLVSPVKKAIWVRWPSPGYPALLAGISALSKRTAIADDRLPTYALPNPLFHQFLEKGLMAGCLDAEEANAKIEVWSYDPKLLSDEVVDPFSLYLSLRYSADERVQQQIERLIEEVL